LKRCLGLALVVLLLLGSFVWGFATERFRIFPIKAIRRAAVVLGLRGWSDAVELKSPSPALVALRAMPYLSGSVDPNAKATGVLVSDPGESAPGLNFFSTLGHGDAFLVDNEGKLLWRWSLERRLSPGELRPGVPYGYTHLFPNGDVLAFVDGCAVVKLDKDSRLLWRHDALVHHDAFVADDGTIYALVREKRNVSAISGRYPSLVDDVEVLSPTGERQRVISVFDVIQNSPYASLLPRTTGLTLDANADAVDVLHTNHVEVYDGSLEKLSPLFRRGNLLLSIKNLNAIAIVDGATSQVLWLWGPTNLALQHHPTILRNGDVLLFNNGTGVSQIVEVDPRTSAVTWRYAPASDFYSEIRGACQRLPNGNTLITLSQKGYGLEVTPAGRTVWTYANPSISANGVRDAIYRMTRYTSASLTFLGSSAP
jgi:hypothetical protein